MKPYDDGKTGIALEPHFVETHAGNLHVYEDRTQAGDIVFITTDNFKKYIPIEWIEMFLEENYPIESPYGTKAYFHDFMKRMIKKWEKENEANAEH